MADTSSTSKKPGVPSSLNRGMTSSLIWKINIILVLVLLSTLMIGFDFYKKNFGGGYPCNLDEATLDKLAALLLEEEGFCVGLSDSQVESLSEGVNDATEKVLVNVFGNPGAGNDGGVLVNNGNNDGNGNQECAAGGQTCSNTFPCCEGQCLDTDEFGVGTCSEGSQGSGTTGGSGVQIICNYACDECGDDTTENCANTGETCSSTYPCCNDQECVDPDGDGVGTCGGDDSCGVQGLSCDTDADCCGGYTCQYFPGQGFMCEIPGLEQCAGEGESCTGEACCNGLTCDQETWQCEPSEDQCSPCVESDLVNGFGDTPDVYSNISGYWAPTGQCVNFEDECNADGTVLTEFYCGADGNILQETYYCNCVDGQCIDEDQCVDTGESCSVDNDCCTGSCEYTPGQGFFCSDNVACADAGESCTGEACCDGLYCDNSFECNQCIQDGFWCDTAYLDIDQCCGASTCNPDTSLCEPAGGLQCTGEYGYGCVSNSDCCGSLVCSTEYFPEGQCLPS